VTRSVLLLIFVSVVMSSLAQIALKAGLKQPGVVEALAEASAWAAAQVVASSPMVWVGLGIYGVSTIVWLLVLARVDVSLAYPFVGLGFVLTMLLGWLVHGEVLTPTRVGGTLLIVAGVVVLGRS
jgi:multidrug transporter EmrE-like cation transporter